jgi:hypothetical protein
VNRAPDNGFSSDITTVMYQARNEENAKGRMVDKIRKELVTKRDYDSAQRRAEVGRGGRWRDKFLRRDQGRTLPTL